MSLGVMRPGSTASTVSAGCTDAGGRASSRRSPWAASSTVSSSRPHPHVLHAAALAHRPAARLDGRLRSPTPGPEPPCSLSAAATWAAASVLSASVSAFVRRRAASPRFTSLSALRSLRWSTSASLRAASSSVRSRSVSLFVCSSACASSSRSRSSSRRAASSARSASARRASSPAAATSLTQPTRPQHVRRGRHVGGVGGGRGGTGLQLAGELGLRLAQPLADDAGGRPGPPPGPRPSRCPRTWRAGSG